MAYNNSFSTLNFAGNHVFHTITNFEPEELGWYEKAVRLCNKRNKNTNVYLVREAYDCNGRRISDWMAVKYKGEDPRCSFWECFEQVKEKYPEPPAVSKKVKFKKESETPIMCSWEEEQMWNQYGFFQHDDSANRFVAKRAAELEKKESVMFIDNRKK